MKGNIIKEMILFICSLFLIACFVFFYYPIRNVHWIFLLLSGILLHFLIKRSIGLIDYYQGFWKTKRVSLFLFLLIFPLILMFSTKGSQIHLQDNGGLIVCLTYVGTYAVFICIVAWLLYIFLSVPSFNGDKNTNKGKILFYALPPLFVWLFFWVAFFPGGMTPDSLSQWEQAHTGQLNNWHPVAYTWFIMFLTKIWDSPAIVTLAQIIIISVIIGYLCYLMEKYNFPKWMSWGISILFAISPINSIYSIIIWKDVLYSAFLLLFSIFILNIVRTKGYWLENNSCMILFFLGSLGLVFFRHNGIYVFFLTMLVLAFCFIRVLKRLLISFVCVVFIYLTVTGPIFSHLNVKPSDPNEALSIPTQQIATIIVKDGYMTEEQKEYIDTIFPLELWKERFNPYNTNPIKFSWGEYKREVIFEDPVRYFKTWLQLCFQNPVLAVEGFLKQTSLVWQINEPDDGYTDTFVTNVYYGNKFGLKNVVISKKVTDIANTILVNSRKIEEILWRPAVYTYGIILLAFVTYLKNDYRSWLIVFPVLLNTLIVMAALPAQDFRYLYGNTLVLYLAFIACFMHLKERRNNDGKYDPILSGK